MGQRGPAPATISVLSAKGQYRKDRHAERAEMPEATGEPEKPAGLCEDGSWLWDTVLRSVKAGQIKLADTAILWHACEVWGLMRKVHNQLVNAPGDKNLRIAFNDYSSHFTALAAKLGITPVDRARIRVEAKETKDNSKSRFFKKA